MMFPFTFIMLADWLFIQHRQASAGEFFARPAGILGWFSWSGAVAFLLGFAISGWGNHVLPGFFYNVLPLPVVGSLIAAAVYLLLALPVRERLTVPRQESRGAA